MSCQVWKKNNQTNNGDNNKAGNIFTTGNFFNSKILMPIPIIIIPPTALSSVTIASLKTGAKKEAKIVKPP